MNREHKAALLYVIVWSAVVACSQAAAPAELAASLRDIVKNERFQSVTGVRGLPLVVRDGLQNLFGSETLDIAEPSAEFQVDDIIVNPNLRNRRLVAAVCTMEYC